MVALDEKKIADIKRGELIGYLSLLIAIAGVIFFAVCYPVARVKDLSSLLLLSYILAPVLIALGSIGGALCNVKYSANADKLIRQYILDICLENPQAIHPERDSLTFRIELEGCKFLMHANGYKENLVFDFSAFKRLWPMRRASIATEICNRLIISFCRLYERGAKYKEVNYIIQYGRKKSKTVPILTDGVPDKRSFKIYLKNKN